MMELERLHPSTLARARRVRDVAYGCFGYWGVALSAAFVWNRLPTDWWLYRAGAFVLSHPISMVGLVATGGLGISLAIAIRRDLPLVMLAFLIAAVPCVLFAVTRSGVVRDIVAGPFFVVVTLACLTVPSWWFRHRRRRWLRAARPPTGE